MLRSDQFEQSLVEVDPGGKTHVISRFWSSALELHSKEGSHHAVLTFAVARVFDALGGNVLRSSNFDSHCLFDLLSAGSHLKRFIFWIDKPTKESKR